MVIIITIIMKYHYILKILLYIINMCIYIYTRILTRSIFLLAKHHSYWSNRPIFARRSRRKICSAFSFSFLGS